jgi:hypothetical protein
MANPYVYPDYDFRWTARWTLAWPTIVGRLNEIMERVDWCRWEIRNSVSGGTGALPTGYYDDPYEIGAGYLWHDSSSHVFRVSETIPADAQAGVIVGMGGYV